MKRSKTLHHPQRRAQPYLIRTKTPCSAPKTACLIVLAAPSLKTITRSMLKAAVNLRVTPSFNSPAKMRRSRVTAIQAKCIQTTKTGGRGRQTLEVTGNRLPSVSAKLIGQTMILPPHKMIRPMHKNAGHNTATRGMSSNPHAAKWSNSN